MPEERGLRLQIYRFGCRYHGPHRDRAIHAGCNEGFRIRKNRAGKLTLMKVLEETEELQNTTIQYLGVFNH
jgi:hypothetical protein